MFSKTVCATISKCLHSNFVLLNTWVPFVVLVFFLLPAAVVVLKCVVQRELSQSAVTKVCHRGGGALAAKLNSSTLRLITDAEPHWQTSPCTHAGRRPCTLSVRVAETNIQTAAQPVFRSVLRGHTQPSTGFFCHFKSQTAFHSRDSRMGFYQFEYISSVLHREEVSGGGRHCSKTSCEQITTKMPVSVGISMGEKDVLSGKELFSFLSQRTIIVLFYPSIYFYKNNINVL